MAGEPPAGRGGVASGLVAARRGLERLMPGRGRQERAAAESLARLDLAETPNFFHLTGLQFQRRDQEGQLLDLLLGTPDRSLASLRGLAATRSLALRLGRGAEFDASLAAWAAGPSGHPAAFLSVDHLAWLRRDSDAAGQALLSARKYCALQDSPPDSLVAAAERLRPAALVERPLEDLLLAVRADPARPEASWRAGLRFGLAADHLVCDAMWAGLARKGTLPPWIDADLIGQADTARAAFGFADGRGLLLATFHAGHLGMVRWLFRQAFRDGVTVGMGDTETEEGQVRRVSLREDAKATLFSALRLLQEGRMLLIAPDGPHGAARLPVTILGRPFSIGEGTPFVLYESGAASAFFTFRFDGARFVPHVVPGPDPAPGERYRDFRARWAAFYAGEIDAIFRGPPETIAFRRQWLRLLLKPDGEATPRPQAGAAVRA